MTSNRWRLPPGLAIAPILVAALLNFEELPRAMGQSVDNCAEIVLSRVIE